MPPKSAGVVIAEAVTVTIQKDKRDKQTYQSGTIIL
jgi:hypothetical protein